MNLELFIAGRLYGTRKGTRRISRPAVTIAQWGVTIGAVIMFVSICIIVGFKQQVRNKITGFSGHIQVHSNDTFGEMETSMTADSTLLMDIATASEVLNVRRYVQKAGIIIANNEYEGIVLKGIGEEYDPVFFAQNIIEGEIPQFSDSASSNAIIISRTTANRLNCHAGEKISIYFPGKGIKARRMTIAAIYETHLAEIDNLIALTDISTMQRLNNWSHDKVTALEITIKEFDHLHETRERINSAISEASARNKEPLYAPTTEELYPALFGWLGMLDQTVWIILILVLGISGFTMVSGLLILILEKSGLIGILKAVGAKDASIRKIFLYYACFIVGKGLIVGNIIATALCLLQQHYGIVALDPEMYYMNRVPIEFTWLLLPMNIGMFIISVAMLTLPSMLISRIEPTKAIKFE